jgi:hypothetical protein
MSQQFMDAKAMAITAHHPCLPALAPSDFYRVGHVKDLLSGQSFETGEQSLSEIESISGCLEKSTLIRFFLEWTRRPERRIETDGEWIG